MHSAPPEDPHFKDEETVLIPADKLAELALIGAILLEPPTIEKLDFLQPSDFYYSQHSEIFSRMRRLWQNGDMIDPVLVADRDDEIYSLCVDAFSGCPTALHVQSYARRVQDLSQKRRYIGIANTLVGYSVNGKPSEGIADFLIAEVEALRLDAAGDAWQLHSAQSLVEPPPAREWLLDGLIYRGQISMWYGPPGIRKSLLLMSMCASMTLGKNWLIRRSNQADHDSLVTFHAIRSARILWLDYDNGEFETKIRIRAALTAHDGLDAATFEFMSETTPWLALDNPAHVRRIISLAKSVDADVIVIDALGMVLGEVDENAPAAAKVIMRLKEIRAVTGAAILCVHHPSKAGAQTPNANTYNAAGSAKFSNFFEWTIELRRGEETGQIVAEVVKHRGWAKTAKFAAELEYTHFGDERPELAHELETFRFYPAPLIGKADKRAEAIREAVIQALAGGELNQTQLVAAVMDLLPEPTGDKTIRQTIKKMVEAGVLTARATGERRPIFYSTPTPVG